MIQFLLMLLGLTFGNHNSNTSNYNNTNNSEVQSSDVTTDPGPGPIGPIGGNTGQTPP